MISIALEHVSAEEVLAVVRPLVGLTADANTSTDINISTDTFGSNLYASGKPEKLQILKEMAKRLDVAPDQTQTRAPADPPRLKRHRVMNSDLAMAYSVLETLLANSPVVRMSKEEKTNSIIAFATSADHDLIEKTLIELSGEASGFNVIPLRRIDPQTAITALEKVFGKKTEKDTSSTIPTLLGDPVARTLMVQCTPVQLAQIQSIIDKLEDNGTNATFGDGMKQIPGVTGKSAAKLLKNIESLYMLDPTRSKTKIRVINPNDKGADAKESRRVPPEETLEKSDKKLDPKSPVKDASYRSGESAVMTSLLATLPTSLMGSVLVQERAQPPQGEKQTIVTPSGKEIVVFQGPTGLIITSEDKEALAEFEQIARMISDQMAMAPPEPATIYLKHIKAQAASELLKNILTGEASGGGNGGLLGTLAGNALGELGGGMFRGLLGGGSSSSGSSSTVGIAAGKPMIIPDPRLNALIVTATPLDMDLIEQLIDIIDQAESPVDDETRGTVKLIPILHNDVEEIAKTVKELFKDRIAGEAAAGGGGGGGGGPNPQQIMAMMQGALGGGRGGRGGGAGGQSAVKESTMSIAADTKSNSLIVLAPPSLFEQVKETVEILDSASEQQEESTVVTTLGGDLNPSVIQRALQSFYGAQIKSSIPQTTNPNQTTNNNQRGGQQGQRNFQNFNQGMGGFGGFPQGGGGAGGQGRTQGFGGGNQGFGGGGFGGNQGFGGGNRGGAGGAQGFGGGNRGGAGAAGGNRGGGR